jgi:CDP-diacylglycerol--glycerol-3-phosphate 3-phosphatidyltransferase
VKWKKQLPMAATSVRFVMAPIIFIVMLTGSVYAPWIAAVLFILGSLTDWLDGYWARIFKAESNMGRFMDPIADKILVLSVLIILLYYQRIDPISPTILLSRDIFIGGIRSVAAADNVVISAKPTGKWKTGIQMVAVPCLFVDYNLVGTNLHTIGTWFLWISVVLSIISGIEYTRGYFKGARNL